MVMVVDSTQLTLEAAKDRHSNYFYNQQAWILWPFSTEKFSFSDFWPAWTKVTYMMLALCVLHFVLVWYRYKYQHVLCKNTDSFCSLDSTELVMQSIKLPYIHLCPWFLQGGCWQWHAWVFPSLEAKSAIITKWSNTNKRNSCSN